MSKEATSKKKASKKTTQDNIEQFISLANDLKEIVIDHNSRISEVESLMKRIAKRMGL